MRNDHGSSWNPNVVGPLDRCPRCWMPVAQDLAYCATCGDVSQVFDSLPLERGERCRFHRNRAAEWTCCLCQRPICKECCARETNPFTTFGPLWHCSSALMPRRQLRPGFSRLLQRQTPVPSTEMSRWPLRARSVRFRFASRARTSLRGVFSKGRRVTAHTVSAASGWRHSVADGVHGFQGMKYLRASFDACIVSARVEVD